MNECSGFRVAALQLKGCALGGHPDEVKLDVLARYTLECMYECLSEAGKEEATEAGFELFVLMEDLVSSESLFDLLTDLLWGIGAGDLARYLILEIYGEMEKTRLFMELFVDRMADLMLERMVEE